MWDAHGTWRLPPKCADTARGWGDLPSGETRHAWPQPGDRGQLPQQCHINSMGPWSEVRRMASYLYSLPLRKTHNFSLRMSKTSKKSQLRTIVRNTILQNCQPPTTEKIWETATAGRSPGRRGEGMNVLWRPRRDPGTENVNSVKNQDIRIITCRYRFTNRFMAGVEPMRKSLYLRCEVYSLQKQKRQGGTIPRVGELGQKWGEEAELYSCSIQNAFYL